MRNRFSRAGGEIELYHEITTYLMVVCGYGALFATGEVGIFFTILISAGVVLSIFLLPEESSGSLFWNMLVLLVMVWGIYEWIFTEDGFVKGVVHFLVSVQVIRLLSRRTDRDTLWVYILSFFQLAAAAILTLSMSFLLFLFLYTIICTIALMMFTLKRDKPAAAAPGRRALFSRAFIVLSVIVSLVAFIFAMVFFFTIPRLGVRYFGWINIAEPKVSGFGENIDLGEVGRIKMDRSTVLRIRIEGETAPRETIYWRGIVLKNFDGRTWIAEPGISQRVYPKTYDIFSLEFLKLDELVKQEIFLEPTESPVLIAMDRPKGFSFERAGFINMGGTRRVFMGGLIYHGGEYWSLPIQDVIRDRVSYTAWSKVVSPSASQLETDEGETPLNVNFQYLQLPPLDPKMKKLAQKITSDKTSRYQKAISVQNYLLENFTYSLEPPNEPPEDPLGDFLFKSKKGWCEHFATAMAILLRTVDVPTRVVTGFQRGEWNKVDFYYQVRQSDAHSWVEVYFPENGWVRFDPTPSASITYSDKGGIWQRLQQILDAARYRWNRWFVDYSFADQAKATIVIRNRGERVGTAFYRQTARFISKLKKNALPIGIVVISVVLTATLILSLSRRHIAFSFRKKRFLKVKPGGEFRSLYFRTLRDLRKRGLGREQHQTPIEHARWVVSKAGMDFAQLEKMADLFSEFRYGDKSPSIEDLRTAKDIRRHIKKLNLDKQQTL